MLKTEYDDFVGRPKQLRIAPKRRYAMTGLYREREHPCKIGTVVVPGCDCFMIMILPVWVQ